MSYKKKKQIKTGRIQEIPSWYRRGAVEVQRGGRGTGGVRLECKGCEGEVQEELYGDILYRCC